MRIVLLVLLGAMLCVGAAMIWQQLRYLNTRRNFVQDHQPLVYGSDAFHAVVFLRMPVALSARDVIAQVRQLRDATQGLEGAEWVYAGKVAMPGNVSSQIGEVPWSAIVVVQYPSRAAYERAAASDPYRKAVESFDETYTQGFKRPAGLNLLVHQALLARRVVQRVRREPSNFPFVRKPGIDADPRAAIAVQKLLADEELGANAAVVVNLQKTGSPEQQASDRGYVGRMMSAMAEGGYGPMHLGPAVRVERDYDFDSVAIVYYPGVQFFADMLRSEFFQGIIGGKQLGDTQATITVPILDRL